MNMELNKHAEPRQTSVGKKENASAPMSLIGDAWNFMNIGIEIESTPEVELPQPPCWANCEEHDSDGEVTVTEKVALSKEDRSKASPLEMLQERLL